MTDSASRPGRIRWIARWLLWGGLSACGETDQAAGTPEPGLFSGGAPVLPSDASAPPTVVPMLEAGVSTAAWPSALEAGGASDAGTTDAAPGAALAGLPENVCSVLRDNGCINCHQQPLTAGAPMALQSRGNFQGKARDGALLTTKLLARVQDALMPMPPTSSGRPLMPAKQVETLRAWFEAGMPGAATQPCAAPAAPADDGSGWANQPWPEGECEYEFTIGAHGVDGTPRASDTSPYLPPATDTSYHCFYEKVPWGDKKVQALAVRTHLDGPDDKATVHHLVLSALAPNSQMSLLGGETPTRGGQHHDCPNQSGSTVAVWGPGKSLTESYPKDVGIQMPSGAEAYFELQVHYAGAKKGAMSRVAFDVCATTKARPNTAGIHWLGFENATLSLPLEALPELQPALDNKGNGVAVGTCEAKERAHILWLQPHMHGRGRYTTVEILRKGGKVETVLAAPFTFSDQTVHLQRDLWIEQGESVRTTCNWDTTMGKIAFGLSAQQEMCFLYALAYPVGALKGVGAELGVVGGELNCAGAP